MRWLKTASLIVVGLVLVVLALMGLLYATRGTPARGVLAFRDPAGPPPATDTSFVRSMSLLTHTGLELGHRVEILNNAEQTFPRLWQDLRSATRSIELQFYYAKPGKLADSLKTIVMERARAGVQVMLLLDAFGAQDLRGDYVDSLSAAGVRVAEFRPLRWYTLHKAQNRSHNRIVVIDGTIAYTGGFGISDQWLEWRETNVRFTGPAVAQMKAAFSVGWAEAAGELLTGNTYFSSTHASADTAGGQIAGLLFAVPSLGSTSTERFLALSIAGARHRLYITNAYFIPDDNFCRALISAAQRGVDVRVLTAGRKTDVRIVRRASHARYERLLRGGVRIFEYQPTMIHSKTMVVDGVWSTVGTINFDNRSMAFNDESNLLVWDARIGAALERQFIADLRHSNEFKLDLFSKRSLRSRILDGAASQISKLL